MPEPTRRYWSAVSAALIAATCVKNHLPRTALWPAACGLVLPLCTGSTSVAVLQPYLALAHLAGYPNISPSSANVYTLQLLISTAGGPTSVSATLACCTRCINAKSSQKNAKIQFSKNLSVADRLFILQKNVGMNCKSISYLALSLY